MLPLCTGLLCFPWENERSAAGTSLGEGGEKQEPAPLRWRSSASLRVTLVHLPAYPPQLEPRRRPSPFPSGVPVCCCGYCPASTGPTTQLRLCSQLKARSDICRGPRHSFPPPTRASPFLVMIPEFWLFLFWNEESLKQFLPHASGLPFICLFTLLSSRDIWGQLSRECGHGAWGLG